MLSFGLEVSSRRRSGSVFMLLLLIPCLPAVSSRRPIVNQAFRRTRTVIDPPIHSKHRILCRSERGKLFPSSCSIELSLLLRLRGGSDYREDVDAAASYYQQQPQQSASNERRYQEDWEIPATAAVRNRYASPQQQQSPPSTKQHDDEYYHDRGLPSPRERLQQQRQSPASKYVPSILSRGNKKMGLTLLAAGAAVTMLGISLFFNKTLMRLGNLLVIAGVPLTIGPSRIMGYFMQTAKARSTACLALGIFLVFVGWPVFGIALELFGLLNLFGNMFPIFWAVAKQTPIVGNLLKQGSGSGRNKRSNGPTSNRRRYYDDPDDIDRRRKEEEQFY